MTTFTPISNPFNRSLEFNPMINHFVKFQSALASFKNSALFIGGRMATKQQLVPMIARAEVQLCQHIVDGVKNGHHGYVERQVEELSRLNEMVADLCLRKDVSYYIAQNTPTRG